MCQVKTLPPGHSVGYGNTYVTSASETVALVPVGYSDGFRYMLYFCHCCKRCRAFFTVLSAVVIVMTAELMMLAEFGSMSLRAC